MWPIKAAPPLGFRKTILTSNDTVVICDGPGFSLNHHHLHIHRKTTTNLLSPFIESLFTLPKTTRPLLRTKQSIMSPHSKQVYCYDSDSHSDDLLLSTLQSSVLYSSSQRVSSKDVDHHTRFFMTDKMTEATKASSTSTEDSKGLLQCWWLPKASKQPRHHAGHRSASARPQLVEDPYLTRTYHGPNATCAPRVVLDGRPPREDSTTRRVLTDSGGVPDSDSLLWSAQDSVSRPPLTFATAHTATKRPHKSSSSSLVSTYAINPPSILHKSSNINCHNTATTSIIHNIMTPETHQENGSWGERPRSRSIAIVKRHHQRNANHKSENDFDASTATFDESPSDTSSTERMYDWATWCMYNRIIDHRRNSMNSSTRSSLSESSMPATSESFGDHGTDLPESSSSSTRNASEAPWDYCHDGEVFELEI